jgi:hypothetical protein
MRVYVAATTERLRVLAADGELDGEWEGFAADDGVRAALGDVEEEELEYALSIAAGEASAAMGGDVAGPGRRLVVVADVDTDGVGSDPGTPGAVVYRGSIRLSDVDAVLAGGSGTAGEAEELGWYGVQEIEGLLRPE